MSRRPRSTDHASARGPAAPCGAGRDRTSYLGLVGLGPGRLCAQWDIPGGVWASARRRSPDTRPSLRLYRLDPEGLAGSGAILFVDGSEGIRRIDAREGVFVAEFGLLHPDGRFDRLAASHPAAVPSAAESNDLSLAIVDVRAPPAVAAAPSYPATRFLRLFANARHPQWRIRPDRRRPVPSGAPPAPPAPVLVADVPDAALSLSAAGLEGGAAGWPLALRAHRNAVHSVPLPAVLLPVSDSRIPT